MMTSLDGIFQIDEIKTIRVKIIFSFLEKNNQYIIDSC